MMSSTGSVMDMHQCVRKIPVGGACAMIYDGTQQTGASAALPVGEHECCEPHMPLNDAAESIFVTPGCSLTLYEHFFPGTVDPYGYGTGMFHTFTNDGSAENDDLSILQLGNNVSSYQCTCSPETSTLAPTTTPASTTPASTTASTTQAPAMNLSVYAGTVINYIEIDDENYGGSKNNGGDKNVVPMQSGERVLRMEYGINKAWVGWEHNNAICGLFFITNLQRHGPYGTEACPVTYSVSIPDDQSLAEFLTENLVLKSTGNWILGFKARV